MPVEVGSKRPANVTLAIKLLIAVIGIGIIQVAMLAVRHIDVRSPEVLISIKLAIYAFSLFLLYQISRGRNWARWSLVPILIIAIPLVVLPTFQSFSHYPIYNLLEVAQLVLYLIALGLLFHGSSSGWFVKKK